MSLEQAQISAIFVILTTQLIDLNLLSTYFQTFYEVISLFVFLIKQLLYSIYTFRHIWPFLLDWHSAWQ